MPNNSTKSKERAERPRAALRRVPVRIRWLERYGIQRGDTALVAMNGDVRQGELGYFSIKSWYDKCTFNQFAFVCEPDRQCEERSQPVQRVCLREQGHKCVGRHEHTPYGRVVGFERKRRPVKTTLPLRPYDEREGGPTTRLPSPADSRPEVEPETTARVRYCTPKSFPPPDELAVVRVTSDELADSGIRSGAVVVAQPDAEPPPGSIAMVRCQGLRLLKRYREAGGIITLTDDTGESVPLWRGEEAAPYGRAVWVCYCQSGGGGCFALTPPGRDAATEAKLRELRERLRKLDEEDDQIIRCSERFKLERQIYALEHAPSPGDAWPEYIAA